MVTYLQKGVIYILAKSQSDSISTIRCIATLMIVSCHILQGYNNPSAYWVNVGVQIFLFMSGFLYGGKSINNFYTWFKVRLVKILIPSYILITIYLLYYQFVEHNTVSYKEILMYLFSAQGILGVVPGLNHLWFLTAIILCYMFVPILQWLRTKLNKYPLYLWILTVLTMFVIIQLCFLRLQISFGAWISTFAFGYLLSSRYKFSIPKKALEVLTVLTLIIMPITIYLQYFYFASDIIESIINSLVIPWTHCLLGSWIFSILYNVFIHLMPFNKHLMRVIKCVDLYSFEIYLTHHIFIISPLSLLFFTPNYIFNIFTIIIITACASFILNRIALRLSRVLHFDNKNIKAMPPIN